MGLPEAPVWTSIGAGRRRPSSVSWPTSATVLGFTLSDTKFHSGWTVGGGAEWAFAGPWSAKAEYMFARYSSQDYFASIAPGLSFGMDVHTVKAGINYRFNWGGPVVAKY